MFPATSRRVQQNSATEVNRKIQRQMEARVARYRNAAPDEIAERLEELDQEWDTERTLEANAATLAFTGCILSAAVDRRWIALPLTVSAFLLQHALQGWCPPMEVIRRLGVRTMREIDEERMALKALRGDFRQISSDDGASIPPTDILRAAQL